MLVVHTTQSICEKISMSSPRIRHNAQYQNWTSNNSSYATASYKKKSQQAKICNEPFLSSCTVINDSIQKAVIAKPECVGTSKHQHLIGRWWGFPLQNQNTPSKIKISHTAYQICHQFFSWLITDLIKLLKIPSIFFTFG